MDEIYFVEGPKLYVGVVDGMIVELQKGNPNRLTLTQLSSQRLLRRLRQFMLQTDGYIWTALRLPI
jgi:hypothetical protein